MDSHELAMIIVALVSFWGTIGAIAYLFYSTRNRERLALINKGADASIFNINPNKDTNDALKLGMTAIGVGVGFFLAGIVSQSGILPHRIATICMPLIFGGLGLVGYYFTMKSKEE
jgi:hypothetical protein